MTCSFVLDWIPRVDSTLLKSFGTHMRPAPEGFEGYASDKPE
jgi:hypothetical protein